jgi:hypothetical protein
VGHGVGGAPIRAWCNPPYSRGMVGAFVAKAAGTEAGAATDRRMTALRARFAR